MKLGPFWPVRFAFNMFPSHLKWLYVAPKHDKRVIKGKLRQQKSNTIMKQSKGNTHLDMGP